LFKRKEKKRNADRFKVCCEMIVLRGPTLGNERWYHEDGTTWQCPGEKSAYPGKDGR